MGKAAEGIRNILEKSPKILVKTQFLDLDLPNGFPLKHGGNLKEIKVAYESYGELNSNKDNVIFVCTPLTMDAHAAGWHSEEDKYPGWWDEMIGPNKALDTNKYQVIVTNMLGGCQGTTGPASINPDTGKPYGSSFPRISIEDIVEVQYQFLRQLGIESLAAVIGGSLGGMQALQWSVAHPDIVGKCICVAAAPHLSPQALGFEIVGRSVLQNDKNFSGGDYYSGDKPDKGLTFARMVGLITYLSADSMHSKFGRKRRDGYNPNAFETGYEVESYLSYNGRKFCERFDANSYLHITYAMDTFDLEESFGSLEKAFENVKSEFLIVALSSDWLFPPEQSRAMCQSLLKLGKIASFLELNSPYGHDAFLLEVGHLSQVIHGFLNKSHDGLIIPEGQKKSEKAEKMVPEEPVLYQYFDSKPVIGNMLEAKSHILDIGSGKGELIDYLYQEKGITGFGVEINLENTISTLEKNVPVVHGDVDNGLSLFADNSFDYAILDRTMQMLKRPEFVLKEILRVAEKGIIVFPNFGNIKNRVHIALNGVMPTTEGLPFNWWESPNIHMFTYKDFYRLCRNLHIKVEESHAFGRGTLNQGLLSLKLKNLGAEIVVVKISRASGF